MPTPDNLLTRTFSSVDFELREQGDLLTVIGLCVPYNREAEIAEPRSTGVFRYREMFVPGAFERAMRAPNRVGLLFEHGDGPAFDQRLGFGKEFRESAEGLVGVFRLDRSRAEHARDVLTTSHQALSIGFLSIWPKPNTERAGDLVVRQSVALAHVAAVTVPAYAMAGVTAVRGAEDGEPTAADLAVEQQLREDAELRRWFEEHKEYQT